MDPLVAEGFRAVDVPEAATGVAWLRSRVARFSEGAEHVRRRALTEDLISGIDLASLRRPGAPVANLAVALGLPRDPELVAEVAAVATSYQPHVRQDAAADTALERLVERCGGQRSEQVAAVIGLLVQTHDATRAWLSGARPPVPATRRITPDGDEVLVDLSDRPFGAGRHACPGQEVAMAMTEGASRFRRLHHGEQPLVLPNAWDLGSALALVAAGFDAIGTTSLGVAAGNGLPDAAGASAGPTLALARELGALPVPVTVDVEAGFGQPLGELAATLSAWGVAGINLEDGRGAGLADPAEQAAMIHEAKARAPELFINARTDTYWLGVERDQTLDRLRRYVDAGADGVFVPGITDLNEIAALTSALDVPLNVLAQRPVPELAQVGVRRVSTGSLLYRAAMHAALDAARQVASGIQVGTPLTYEQVQQWSAD